MAAETQYTANTGMALLVDANSNYDGTGALDVLTAASNGTLIKTVTIKAIKNTTHGMIRLYAYDGTNTKLIYEVEVPATTKASTDPAFETIIPLNYILKASGTAGKLKASSQKGDAGIGTTDNFIVIAEGLDFVYYASVRPESTKYTANTAMATIATANANLDGTGTIGTVLTAASNGTLIESVVIKAQVTTTKGMIRLFINNPGVVTRLLMEVPVPVVTKSSTAHSFSRRIDFGGKGFALKPGWILGASTEIAQSFNVIAEGLDWTYPA